MEVIEKEEWFFIDIILYLKYVIKFCFSFVKLFLKKEVLRLKLIFVIVNELL